jgi:predicted ATPase
VDRNQLEEAARVIEEGLALAHRTSEGLYEPELFRLRGEVLLRRAPTPDDALIERAADDFRRSLEIARRQETKSLALRAAMSLARLGSRFAAVGDGRDLLAEIYGSFTEGFETPDLREAKRMLDN